MTIKCRDVARQKCIQGWILTDINIDMGQPVVLIQKFLVFFFTKSYSYKLITSLLNLFSLAFYDYATFQLNSIFQHQRTILALI